MRHRSGPRGSRARATALVVAAGAAVLVATGAPAAAAPDPLAAAEARIASLPAPYADWNVTIGPKADEPGALTLAYDSPALQRRSENAVYLPSRYRPDGPASPVLYFLHGTVVPAIDDPALDPVTDQEMLVSMVASGGGNAQTVLTDFPARRDEATFLVVAPDTHPTSSWCDTCFWVDGRDDVFPNLPPVTAETVPAETVLNHELVPLVEQVFHTRTDRGGRGIAGFSMGSVGAQLQAFRHPDRYSYVGAISGPIDVVDDPFWRAWVDGLGYLRDQGYATPTTDEVLWRNLNPRDLVGNYAGSGGRMMISAGDVCLPPTDEQGADDCAKYPPVRHPASAFGESQMRRVNDANVAHVAASGVPTRQVRFSGIHGANNHRVYAEVIVPDANAAFADPDEPAEAFTYRTADPAFAVWGYDVRVQRAAPEFLTMVDARRDARSFTLRGHGTVSLRTPSAFAPGRSYDVTVGDRTTSVAADRDGRLPLHVDLYGAEVTVRVP